MNRLRDIDDDLHDDTADREISLGMPTILGIFFALALVCACFFGFGYTMGRRSVPTEAAPVATSPDPSTAAAKPTAGSPAAPAIKAPAAVQAETVPLVPRPTPPSSGSPSSSAPPPSARNAANPADGMIVGDKFPVAGSQSSTTSFIVQVAAVSSQDVADILLASLEKKGYNVAIRREPHDQLLHVQIGPFADRKDAEAMRQRVLADGFNAIVK